MERRPSPPSAPPEKLLLRISPIPVLCSQIHHVDIGAEPDVIGKIPADVIGIIVDDDVV